MAVDCPYTWSDADGLAADTRWARRLGYKAKSAVAPEHAATINRALTPSKAEVDRARRILEAFAGARAGGQSRIELDGSLIEKPLADRAERLLRRAKELGAIEEGG
jgi:citrate lyase subunit beta / citryl-CoA lyase